MLEKIASRYGEIYVVNDDLVVSESLRRYGEWAQLEIDFLVQFLGEGAVVVDVGAFLGTHTRAFSKSAGASGAVIAVEPRADVHHVLEKNCQLVNLKNVSLLQCALGRTRGRAQTVAGDPKNLGAYMLTADEGGHTADMEVKTLDDLGLERLTLLKADVEGMEYDVLLGGKTTIERCRPYIFLEVNSVALGSKLLEWADGNGYRCYAFNCPAFNESNFRRNMVNVFGSGSDTGLFLHPSEMLDGQLDTLEIMPLFRIVDLDDLVLLMVNKTQYREDLLLNRSKINPQKLTWPSEYQYLRDKLNCAHEALALAYSSRRSTDEEPVRPA